MAASFLRIENLLKIAHGKPCTKPGGVTFWRAAMDSKKIKKRYPNNVIEYSTAIYGRKPKNIKEAIFITFVITITNPFVNILMGSLLSLFVLIFFVAVNINPLIPSALTFICVFLFNPRKRILAKFVRGEKS
ncbi:hypothetical protein [Agrobacterium sp. NPDC089420]|uniref:hypothetical protein n=1 Tax=Agrobacterium sp. NPDC089420 TaxID=3363918 RepID=UPI00384D87FB